MTSRVTTAESGDSHGRFGGACKGTMWEKGGENGGNGTPQTQDWRQRRVSELACGGRADTR